MICDIDIDSISHGAVIQIRTILKNERSMIVNVPIAFHDAHFTMAECLGEDLTMLKECKPPPLHRSAQKD